jgi:putative holliday junction resolvase
MLSDTHESTTRHQIIFAFDYGTRRLGIASGDTLTRTARALTTLECTVGIPWPALQKLIEEYQPARFVVGLPYNVDGTPTLLTDASRRFGLDLKRRYERPVALVDERYSSIEASGRLRETRAAGLKRRRTTRADVDMIAAEVVLERWFAEPAAAENL